MHKSEQIILFISITLLLAYCEGIKTAPYKFPDNFIWGASSSAYQTEGGNFNNDWSQWEKSHKLFIPEPCGQAVNSYNLYEHDAELVSKINLNAYRFSIEWSRVEPERNVWNTDEIEHYRKVIKSLVKRGIKPIVTLHHFTNPVWVLNMDKKNNPTPDLGGWLNPDVTREFAEYAGKMAEEFGEYVDWWLTINEPIVIAISGYLFGVFPPGHFDFSTEQIYSEVYRVMKNLITAHSLAYDQIKRFDKKDADGDGISSIISFPETMPVWDPADPADKEDVSAVRRLTQFYTYNILDSVFGKGFDHNLDGKSDEIPVTGRKIDFIGLNYYNRWFVRAIPVMPPPISALPCVGFRGLELSGISGCPHIEGERSDVGYEIYNEGIYRKLNELYNRYRLPILITENGIATTEGEKRAWFLVDNLSFVKKAIEEGIDVIGYLYWSLTDNWEWGDYELRFGLYSVNYDNNLERNLNKGGEVFGEIAGCNCLSDKLIKKYKE